MGDELVYDTTDVARVFLFKSPHGGRGGLPPRAGRASEGAGPDIITGRPAYYMGVAMR